MINIIYLLENFTIIFPNTNHRRQGKYRESFYIVLQGYFLLIKQQNYGVIILNFKLTTLVSFGYFS